MLGSGIGLVLLPCSWSPPVPLCWHWAGALSVAAVSATGTEHREKDGVWASASPCFSSVSSGALC